MPDNELDIHDPWNPLAVGLIRVMIQATDDHIVVS